MKKTLCISTACLVWLTLLLRLGLVALEAVEIGQSPVWAVLCSFQYFTLVTTLLVALALTAAALGDNTRLTGPVFTTMLCVSVLLVAVVYTFMLRHLWEPVGLRKVADVLLHDIIPLLFFIYWWLSCAGKRIPWRSLVVWLVYPVAYLMVIIGIGGFTGSYPYPFLQVDQLGFSRVLVNSLGLLGFYSLLGVFLLTLDRIKFQYTSRR